MISYITVKYSLMAKYPHIFSSLILLVLSCNDSSKLQQREQDLAEKERRFAEKEAEYQTLIKMRDSIISKKDTILTDNNWPAAIAGKWNGKVTCRESNCTDYVVGDIRTDTWEFVSDSLKKAVNVYSNNNELVRTYVATADKNDILLSFRSDSTASKNVEMNVVLNSFSPKKIQGTRDVSVNSSCNAVFTVELSRP